MLLPLIPLSEHALGGVGCWCTGSAAQTILRSPARLTGTLARHIAGAGLIAAAQCQQIQAMAWQHGHMKKDSVKKNPARFQHNRCNNCICSAGQYQPRQGVPLASWVPWVMSCCSGEWRFTASPFTRSLQIKCLQNNSRKVKQGDFILHHKCI